MGWPVVAAGAAVVVGAAGCGAAYVRRKRAQAAAAEAAAMAQANAQPAEQEVATDTGQPFNPGKLVKDLKELGAGGVLGTIGAGLTVSDFAGRAVEALGGGEGKGDLVRVGGAGLLLPVLADIGVQRALEAVGIDNPDVKKGAGQLGAAGAVAGLPGVVGVAAIKGADALLGLISDDAQDFVHDVFRPFDPTNPNSIVGKGVGAVGDAVAGGIGGIGKAIGGLLGGGGPSAEELAARKAAEEAAQRAILAGAVTTQEAAQAIQEGMSGNLGGLVGVGRALAERVAQAQDPGTIFAPAIVPAEPAPTNTLPVASPLVTVSSSNTLRSNQVVAPGDSLTSANGSIKLVHQMDGNVVLYGADGSALWDTKTHGKHTTGLVMQKEGNLVLYGTEGALWASEIMGPGAYAVVETSGDLAVYAADGKKRWSARPPTAATAVANVLRFAGVKG